MKRASRFADLLELGQLSPGRLDAALAREAAAVISDCDRPGSPISRNTLRNAIIASLPEALDVGLREWIVLRWLPSQAPGQTVWSADLDLCMQPSLDLLDDGWPVLGVALSVRVMLEQPGGRIVFSDSAKTLTLGNGRAWRATLELFVADQHQGNPAFHTGRCEVFLPPSPWPAD